jgi:hypothetical protein
MALPTSAFGGQAVGLTVNPLSGFLSNAKAANTGIDPRETAASLTKAGRLSGYARAYRGNVSEFESALARGAGLLQVGTGVDLYRDGAGAASQQAKNVDDLRALVGKPLKAGATVVRSASFRVGGIANGAGGRLEVRIKRFPLYYTMVWLRDGRLLAGVFEARAGPTKVDATVISLAQMLERRIKGVLSGRIRTEPVTPR